MLYLVLEGGIRGRDFEEESFEIRSLREFVAYERIPNERDILWMMLGEK